MTIYSIEKIESEAVDAAKRFSTVDEACPYPFGSTAGFIFTNKFKAERQRQEDAIQNAAAADIHVNLPTIKAVTDGPAA